MVLIFQQITEQTISFTEWGGVWFGNLPDSILSPVGVLSVVASEIKVFA